MKKGGKRKLHERPAEFARAAEVRGTRRWKEEAERDRAHTERMRSVKMPAHPVPLTLEQRLDKCWR